MREKKFRAWFESSQTWVYYSIGSILGGDNLLLYNKVCIDGCEWYEYTGLKDKNGKEIYEGDVCSDEEGYTNPIEWEDDAACFTWDAILFAQPRGMDSNELKVIGNIHENPEKL